MGLQLSRLSGFVGASWAGNNIAGSWTVGLDAPEADALLWPHLGRAIKQSWPATRERGGARVRSSHLALARREGVYMSPMMQLPAAPRARMHIVHSAYSRGVGAHDHSRDRAQSATVLGVGTRGVLRATTAAFEIGSDGE